MSPEALHHRARTRPVNPLVYWPARAVVQLGMLAYLRLGRRGGEHVPRTGGVILAANHRSFLDPFAIALLTRRPLHYVAKRELFAHRGLAWLLSSLGAFPVERGAGDAEMLATARTILARGDAVLIFPEGTRIRGPHLRAPRRGVGRLALEIGVPVVPVAIHGSDRVRRGRWVLPRKVSVRAGAPIATQRIPSPTPEQAEALTRRIWPEVALLWEWLGGAPAPAPQALAPERVASEEAAPLVPADRLAEALVTAGEARAGVHDGELATRTGRFRRA